VSPEQLQTLLKRIERDPNVTYYAINKQGDLKTNSTSEGPTAVTWGVFPGKEVVQPTIVEAVSFMAWKVRRIALFDYTRLTFALDRTRRLNSAASGHRFTSQIPPAESSSRI
jgi:hypothetical protein